MIENARSEQISGDFAVIPNLKALTSIQSKGLELERAAVAVVGVVVVVVESGSGQWYNTVVIIIN